MKRIIPFKRVNKDLLLLDILILILYASWWLIPGNADNLWLFGLLVAGEIYHLFMALTFWFTVWPKSKTEIQNPSIKTLPRELPSVDVFIPVAGEPIAIIEKTATAALRMNYPKAKVYILNDGLVAHKDNWQAVEALAARIGVNCITRKVGGGAKAGNINNALQKTKGEYVALFDADMVPDENFLQETVPLLTDPAVGFVQTPQYYENFQDNNITQASWDQQKLFFGPILRGKDRSNAAFICGTNVVIRRKALEQVGGMVEDNIAEDFLTSLLIHQRGWKSHYVADVLAVGLAPQDLMSYYKQQFRWSRGSLEVLFGQNPLFKSGLSWSQKISYLSSALFYFNGLIVLVDLLMPLIFLFFGLQPVTASTTSFAIYFLPFIFINLFTLNVAANAEISFNTFSLTYSLWYLQLVALVSTLLRIKVGFSVTPKEAQQGSFVRLAIPHLLYILLAIVGSIFAVERQGMTPSVATNIAWALFNITLFMPFISLALQPQKYKQIQKVDLGEERA